MAKKRPPAKVRTSTTGKKRVVRHTTKRQKKARGIPEGAEEVIDHSPDVEAIKPSGVKAEEERLELFAKTKNPGAFKKGHPRYGGRKKGVKNKKIADRETTVKDNFLAVFKELGGVEEMVKWAAWSNDNQTKFYQLYSKLLPREVSVANPDAIGPNNLSGLSDEELNAIIGENG